MEGRYVLCLFVVLFHIHCAQCYSSGAPWYTCITMFPVHNDVQQQPALSSPFQVIADQTSYFPGTILQLKINSTMSGRTFKGFQMRARPVNGDTEQVVGQFVNASTNVSRTLDCLGDVQNVVTNRDATSKEEVTLTWMMSESNFGNIEFVVTFVEDFNTFWTEVTTQITVIGVADELNAEIVSTEFNDINWDSCGSGKGCFLYPRLCSGSNCYTGLTYQITNESLRFEMFGPQLGYIAVGFSEDKLLGYDEMISCTGDGDILSIQRGYSTDDAFFERQYKNGITNIQVSIQDDKLYCSFTRPVSMNIFNEGHTTQTMVDLTQSYYIMLAWGDVFDGTDVLRQYKELPPITDEMVDLSAREIVRGSSMPWETKIHGTYNTRNMLSDINMRNQ
ncbi:DOMON domain-containing protein frrs1L [Mactra antiquata]